MIPQITLSASLLPIPEDFIKKANTILLIFLWDGNDKISREMLMSDYDFGGIKMIDLRSYFRSLKAAWVARLLDETTNGNN
jgi:hypothetical protein